MIATNTNNKWATSKFHKLKQKHKTQLRKHRRESTNIARLWHRNYFILFFASVLLQHVYHHAWLCPGSLVLHAQSRRKRARKGFWGSRVPCFMHRLKGQLGKQEAAAQPGAEHPLLWTPLASFSLAAIVLCQTCSDSLSPTRLISALSEAIHNMNSDSSTKVQCHVVDCYANLVATLITRFNKGDTDFETLMICETLQKAKNFLLAFQEIE